MTTLTRRQVRQLRTILRRSVLGIPQRSALPPVTFIMEAGTLHARFSHQGVAIEHELPISGSATGTASLPLDTLGEFEGRDDSTLTLEPIAADQTRVRWSDHGIPQAKGFTVSPSPTMPERPPAFFPVEAHWLDAVAEAMATCAEEDSRYALGCIALKGDGSIIATDGHQALIQRGFSVPWDNERLVRRVPLLFNRVLPRDQPVWLGATATHVVVQVGGWTVWLEVVTGQRFPDVDRVCPDSGAATSRLKLDPADARAVLDSLDRLPGAEEQHAPTLVELNGRIALRAQGQSDTHPTELTLSRSTYTGSPSRFRTDRTLLGRALRLGFTEVEIADSSTPLACRDERRVFVWQSLSSDQHEEDEPTDITRIDARSITPDVEPTPLREVRSATRSESPTRTPDKPGTVEPDETTSPATLTALIREAEALDEALASARSRSRALVMALRRHRKRARLMDVTLDALRRLKLQDAAH